MIWITPPLAFAVLLAAVLVMYRLSAGLAFKPKKKPAGLEKAYTGGEDVATSRVQPDYSQFFPFAFFFTILHVVTLVVATVPTADLGSFIIAVVYIMGALLGLLIIFRRGHGEA
jgi:NADH-quinone oxidoreductase subunit A